MIIDPFREIYDSKELIADIEITNACNLDCSMCHRQIMTRPVGYMSLHTFGEIIKDLKEAGCRAIRFNGQGEPTIHPSFGRMVDFAKENKMLIHLNTNGTLVKVLHELPIDKIKFSYHGQFDKDLKSFVANRNGTYIQMATTEYNPKEFNREWEGKCDGVHFSIENLRRITGEKTGPLKTNFCNEVMTKLMVYHNGDVTPCCVDYNGELVIGNIKKTSINELLESKKLKDIQAMVNNERQAISLCRDCISMY